MIILNNLFIRNDSKNEFVTLNVDRRTKINVGTE